LKHFDAYPKPLEDFRIKTITGAFISICCGLLVVLLIFYEFNSYMTVVVDQELFVDLTRNQKFTINIDVTFPRLHCSLLSLDTMDVSGDGQIDVVKGVKKSRMDSEGNIINLKEENVEPKTTKTVDDPAAVAVQSSNSTGAISSNESCMSCYGAESDRFRCCNTCDQVRAAYRLKNWHFSPIGVEQCKTDLINSHVNLQASEITKDSQMVDSLIKSKEGCRMYGHLEVNKVAGNFHIAPGVSYQQNHMHVHDVKHIQLNKFNTSHYFDVLSFGDEYPNQYNPLERKFLQKFNSKNSHKHHQQQHQEPKKNSDILQINNFLMFEFKSNNNNNQADDDSLQSETGGAISYNYFLKIVPTLYEFANGTMINNTYQYSLTRSSKSISSGSQMSSGLPGIFIVYELSPIMIKYIERPRSLSHFLTSCCAIIGGVFTVAGLFDAILFRYYNLYKKFQLSKLT
jgi:hypothetical protein